MSGAGAGQLARGQQAQFTVDTIDGTRLLQTQTEESAIAGCVLAAIGLLRCGEFLLDDTRRVLLFNNIAADCLGHGLALRGEHLAATDHESNDRLQRLIRLACNSTESSNASATAAVRRSSRLPLAVRVLRLETAIQRAFNSASLLLLVFDPEVRQSPSLNMLSPLFGLSPAEARIAIGIARGKKLAEIAVDHGVKVGTMRAHSKTVFSKTGTRGQAELAALLARLAVLSP